MQRQKKIIILKTEVSFGHVSRPRCAWTEFLLQSLVLHCIATTQNAFSYLLSCLVACFTYSFPVLCCEYFQLAHVGTSQLEVRDMIQLGIRDKLKIKLTCDI